MYQLKENSRPHASVTLRVSEMIYDKVREVALKTHTNMRDAADRFFYDMMATIATLQNKNEELTKENEALKKEVETWKEEVTTWKKK